ncbi:dihydroxyacetone kinase subunit DhaL [Fusibacter sp. A2]|nr:dihydroxyacetone kinase subunit DhaL [Fusibacter sp. A2]
MGQLTTKNIREIVAYMSGVIIQNEVYFCELDSVAGDGDFGMSIAKGFKELNIQWETLSEECIGTFLKDCGMIITEHCGGASGPIWGSAFRGAGKFATGKTQLSVQEFAQMMQSAVDAIQKRGKAVLGDKTLLDALIPTVEALKESAQADTDVMTALLNGAKAAVEGAEKTKTMVASRGRASYVGERSVGFPDAGAMALGIIFTKIAENIEV